MADQELSTNQAATLAQFMQKLSTGPQTQPKGPLDSLNRAANHPQIVYGPNDLAGYLTPEQKQATDKEPIPPADRNPDSPEMKQYFQALMYAHRNDKQTYELLRQKIAEFSKKPKAPHTKEGI